MTNTKALILAAGFGSRLMPLTANMPKTMVEYKGKKLIEYEIKALQDAGIKTQNIAVVGGYKAEILREYLQNHFNITRFFENKNYASTNMLHSLFCAWEFLNECKQNAQDIIISYADIVYFAPCVKALIDLRAKLAICVDIKWRNLWEARFDDILSDAETLKMREFNGEFFITELGKKPKNLDEIQGQYMGLFKISHEFLDSVTALYDSLDKNAIFDGQPYNNIYMTSFLQAIIDKYQNAKAVIINGGWCEIDFKSDLEIDIDLLKEKFNSILSCHSERANATEESQTQNRDISPTAQYDKVAVIASEQGERGNPLKNKVVDYHEFASANSRNDDKNVDCHENPNGFSRNDSNANSRNDKLAGITCRNDEAMANFCNDKTACNLKRSEVSQKSTHRDISFSTKTQYDKDGDISLCATRSAQYDNINAIKNKTIKKDNAQGAVIWLCGLAGSGKSSLATALVQILRTKFSNVVYLDGDELREIFEHFSYDKQGRIDMAIKRAKMAKFLSNQGQIVVVSTISLFNEVYEFNRANLKNYFEIFVECDFDELKRRDQKGLYTKALRGEMPNIVGVDIVYDTPTPNLRLDNSKAIDLDKKAKFLYNEFLKFYNGGK